MKLTSDQQSIIDVPGNLIVQASAGTGKTHTLISKMEKELLENDTFQVAAAITFTIKAANEIKERLPIDPDDHFIGTNNNFVINEIIKPFMKDVYGKDYDLDMGTDYSVKIKNYNEGIKYIKSEGVLPSYKNNKKNFVFELSYNILKESRVAKKYLQAKYFKIYIDEYQDCDQDMDKLFMYIVDELKISTFIVGDDKQSIYMWRGAYPEAFRKNLEKENFVSMRLLENFRSSKEIQNFSNLLFKDTSHLYDPISSPKDIVWLNRKNWSNIISKHVNFNKNVGILTFTHKDAESNAELLKKQSIDCIYIPRLELSEITTESAWLYFEIAQFCIFNAYSIYDFLHSIPAEAEEDIIETNTLEKLLISIEKHSHSTLNEFDRKVKLLADYLDLKVDIEHVEILQNTINDEKKHVAFNIDNYKCVSMTLHSSKGLEFDQVIIFANDYGNLNEEGIRNLYVSATRAKKKLVIVYNDNYYAKKFVEKLKIKLSENNIQPRDIFFVPT